MSSLSFPRNQVKVNTVCNSESYNGVYNKNQIRSRLYAIDRHVNSLINRNINILSKVLHIDPSGTSTLTPYNILSEYNRRGLYIDSFVHVKRNIHNTTNPEYIMYNINYQYEFDYHSITKSYAISSKETINGVKCKSLFDLDVKTGQTSGIPQHSVSLITYHWFVIWGLGQISIQTTG